MAMGTKQDRQKQEELFYASEQAEAPGHPFYQQLNRVLEQADFDRFANRSAIGFITRNWEGLRWRQACISGCY